MCTEEVLFVNLIFVFVNTYAEAVNHCRTDHKKYQLETMSNIF